MYTSYTENRNELNKKISFKRRQVIVDLIAILVS